MHKLRHLLSPLRVFDALARSGGVGPAAAALHITPGAISQQVKFLEGELGVELFRKEGRQLMLTLEGHALSARVMHAFNDIEAAILDAQDTVAANRIRLRTMPTFATCWLLPRLAEFYEDHADIDIETTTSTVASSEATQGLCDFTIRHGSGKWPHLEADLIFPDRLTPVCAPSLASGIRRPEDLLDMVPLHSHMRADGWDVWLSAVGFSPFRAGRGRTLGTAAMCYQAAIKGLGVAMAQVSYVEADLRAGRLVQPIDFVATTDEGYYVVCDPARSRRPAQQAFRAWIAANATAEL